MHSQLKIMQNANKIIKCLKMFTVAQLILCALGRKENVFSMKLATLVTYFF
jgi:hypothetical protein